MKIYIGADHRGFQLKEELKSWLIQQGHDIEDLGAHELNPDDDYVDYATVVAKSIATLSSHKAPGVRPEDSAPRGTRHQQPALGVVICGSGVGVDIVANRFNGIRCGLALSPDQVRAARNDDDINVLALAADYTNVETAKAMMKTFLETEFSGEERYRRRSKKITALDRQSL